jgi:hypothetical protein
MSDHPASCICTACVARAEKTFGIFGDVGSQPPRGITMDDVVPRGQRDSVSALFAGIGSGVRSGFSFGPITLIVVGLVAGLATLAMFLRLRKQLLAARTTPPAAPAKILPTVNGFSHLKPCSVHEVVHAWLAAEAPLVERQFKVPGLARRLALDTPDFADREQNRQRLRALYGMRRWLWSEIPPDTVWLRGRALFSTSQRVLRAWNFDDQFKPGAVSLDGLIFWGHRLNAPLLLEGNHRYSQWVVNGQPDQPAMVYVGLSPSNCKWFPGDSEVPYGTIPSGSFYE